MIKSFRILSACSVVMAAIRGGKNKENFTESAVLDYLKKQVGCIEKRIVIGVMGK